jgi:hypothetical protein
LSPDRPHRNGIDGRRGDFARPASRCHDHRVTLDDRAGCRADLHARRRFDRCGFVAVNRNSKAIACIDERGHQARDADISMIRNHQSGCETRRKSRFDLTCLDG